MNSKKRFSSYNGRKLMSSRSRAVRGVILTEKLFKKFLLNFFKRHMKDRCPDYAMLMRLYKESFRPCLSTQRFDHISEEMKFSFLEIAQCANWAVIREALLDFLIRQQEKHLVTWKRVARFLLFFRSTSGSVSYFVDSSSGQKFRRVWLHNPDWILDLEVTGRLLRYKAEYTIPSLHMSFNLMAILHCFISRLLPLNFENGVECFRAIHPAYPTPEKQRRLYIVLLVLYVTLRQEDESSPECRDAARCLKLGFQTIDDPFVTMSEISRFLNLVMAREQNDRMIEEIRKRLVKEFPKAEGCMTPRSLKHLSRCEVRRRMGKSRTLPHGVWSLDIPMVLKNYILIQRRKEEFYPKYVAELADAKHSVPDDGPS